MDKDDRDIIEALKQLPAAVLLDAMYLRDIINTQMTGVQSLIAGQKLVGRAVTVRFVPSRPDLKAQVIGGPDSAEYQALELCGQDDVLVMDAMGLSEPSAIGDIKLSRLKQRGGAGVVTDGGVRDIATLKTFNIGVFAAKETNLTMPSHMLPYDYQTAIQCGGVLVMPGDYISADSGGVVVVPKTLAREIIDHAIELECLESAVQAQLAKEDVSPGKYYPFNDAAKALLKKTFVKPAKLP